MLQTNYNERSWAIDLITDINLWLQERNILIKRAGGEHTVQYEQGSLFPDVLLFGDAAAGAVLQGWELKMPDTSIADEELLTNATKKAQALGLQSFLVWNVTTAVLYVIDGSSISPMKTWNDLAHITQRDQVRPNMHQIREMLGTILNDLNQFFAGGRIRPGTIVDAMSNDELINVLISNVDIYAERLEEFANQNYEFEDKVNLWWLSSKLEFPDERNRWKVLARNNLITLFNKFVFAHALKHYNQAANIIDTLNAKVELADGLQLFETISMKSDFWNIFSRNLGEDMIPASTWRGFQELNLFLREFKLESVEQALIHELLENLSLRGKRKIAGQFATPPSLAKLLATLIVLEPAKQALDPCCGTGTIAKAVYDLKVRRGIKEPLETIWASDKFALPLKVATLSVTQPENMGKLLHLFTADATHLQTNQEVILHDPYSGKEVRKKLPKFTYILSNLPFVQQEDLGTLNPGLEQTVNTKIRALTGDQSLGLAARSDLYAYLPFYLWDLLEDDGTLGIIISNSWLATEMGDRFFAALKRFYYVDAIITSGNGRWFQNAKVVTNIIILRKKSNPSQITTSETKYVSLNKTIEEINEEDLQLSARALINAEGEASQDILTVQAYNDEELSYFNRLALPRSSLFADVSWLHKVIPSTVPLSDLFEIARGERRGWDELFFPANPGAVEKEYLKPVLKSPRSISHLVVETDGVAFCCEANKAELKQRGHTGALRWIESFESSVNSTNQPLPAVLAQAGINWYTMQPNTLADFVAAINYGDRLFIGKFTEPAFVNQRLTRLTRKGNVDIDLIHALLNSIMGLFFLESLGFGRGEGALDLSATRFRDSMRVLNPSLISQSNKSAIIEKFKPLLQREILPITLELDDQDRKNFDEVVLQAYGIKEQYENIKKSLLTLYRIRTSVKRPLKP